MASRDPTEPEADELIAALRDAIRAVEAWHERVAVEQRSLHDAYRQLDDTLTRPSRWSGRTAGPHDQPTVELTTTERLILEGLAGGASIDEVAQAIGCAARTVSRHLELLHDRIGTRTMIQLVIVATEQGWLGSELFADATTGTRRPARRRRT